MEFDVIRKRVAASAVEHGRNADDITLIAVSKMQPDERVVPVLDAGHRDFGENKVQEAARKWPAWKEAYPDTRLHLIGPLQSNKARQALLLADAIHTVDRSKLAGALARIAQEEGRCPELFIQVNTGEEPQKAGIAPSETDSFVAHCRELDLPVIGLMCIPPVDETPSLHFSLLAKLAERNGLAKLSMGMSADFEQAIAFGATHVRVGSALFGARD